MQRKKGKGKGEKGSFISYSLTEKPAASGFGKIKLPGASHDHKKAERGLET